MNDSLRRGCSGLKGFSLSSRSEQSEPVEARCRRAGVSDPALGFFSAAALLVTSRKCDNRSFLTTVNEFSEPKGLKHEAERPPSLPDNQARGTSVLELPVPTLFSQKLASLFLLLLRVLRGEGVGDRLAILSSKSGQPLSVELELECLNIGRLDCMAAGDGG